MRIEQRTVKVVVDVSQQDLKDLRTYCQDAACGTCDKVDFCRAIQETRLGTPALWADLDISELWRALLWQ